MKTFDTATAAALAARGGLVTRHLVWITAVNISTTLTETLGLWSGEESLTVTIDGGGRTYTGAGSVLRTEALTSAQGLAVRNYQLNLAAVATEVEDLVKGYETRFAPVEVHRAFFDPATRVLVSEPHRVFKGQIDTVEFTDAAPGEYASCVLSLVSTARALTRTLTLKKSDASQRLRSDDRFRRFGDISGAVPVYWGELEARPGSQPVVDPGGLVDVA